MVSTYPPDRDGIASYTAKVVESLIEENVEIKIAANELDWKRNSISYISSIMQKARESNSDIIHIQFSYFMFGNEYYTGLFPILQLGLKLIGKKIIITFHDIVPKSNLTKNLMGNYTQNLLIFKKWALINYTKIACWLSNVIIVHDKSHKDLLNIDYRVKDRKIRVIPLGNDPYPNENKSEAITKKYLGHKIVTVFGTIRKGKGLENLIKAWEIVSKKVKAQLLIIGGKHPHLKDDTFEKCIKLVKDMKLESSIEFCGYISKELIPTYFTSTDIFVFPYDDWGNVYASSMGLSDVMPYLKPIIATNVPAFAHIKKADAALIVERGNIKDLASAIIEVLTDLQTRELLINNLYNILNDSSWSSSAKKIKTLYLETMRVHK